MNASQFPTLGDAHRAYQDYASGAPLRNHKPVTFREWLQVTGNDVFIELFAGSAVGQHYGLDFQG